ncbi:MAG: IS481 family transposase [Betaproteobacteria bacterium]|nr:MAG: IS481 family transposase [Betaproteobacteria bacterium]TMH24193.1 MAG: IS481 family transposase [Betaproteobacteria bacterium]TMI02626.1 MAG: IS481 family transposase [Betaproteobacteria bacterium]
MDERLRFVARLLEGEKMAALCREFDVSRKTGYKIFQRYKDCGLEGLTDRSRRPYRQANQLPFQIEKLILQLKRERPSWGAPKIREKLRRLHSDLPTPAISTVHAVLDRHGLVSRGRKRRYKAQGTTLSRPLNANDLWCADYKGEFMLADRRYCYPLTISDFASRYLLACEALGSTKETYAFTVFERVFKEFGLPQAIRTDNGVPFASPHALFGLSKLSVWWLRLGIHIERIQPGRPQQNGRHERMHLTLKKETTKPAAQNFLQQQARFDEFIDCYNDERPHQALDMKYPVELYQLSSRPYHGLDELHYPFHDRTITVTQCGRICFGRRKINLSTVLAGQNVGVKEVSDRIWLVSFMDYDLGFFDHETGRLGTAENPFAAKVLPMSPV